LSAEALPAPEIPVTMTSSFAGFFKDLARLVTFRGELAWGSGPDFVMANMLHHEPSPDAGRVHFDG
jgi:hypothetical protein